MVYYERAMILYYIGHSNTQLAQVQCFVILTSFLCSVNCLPQAWLLIGQAVRIAQDLGLHRTPRHLPISPIDKQTRMKVWWSVYTLDRMLAIALGRPLGIDDRDCDTEFPLQVDDDDLQAYLDNKLPAQDTPSPMVGFVALSALFKIGGEVLRGVYSVRNSSIADADIQATIEDLDVQLTDWCDRLPAAFKYLPSNGQQQTRIGSTLASYYYAILITLHRKSLSPRRMGRTPFSNSASKAIQTARACIRLAPSTKDLIPPSHHLAFFVQFLSTSAVIVLLFAMHALDEAMASSAMSEVQMALATLQALEGQWPGARKCTELLESLVDIAKGHMNKSNPHLVAQRTSPRSSPLTQSSSSFTRDGTSRLGKHAVLKQARQYEDAPSTTLRDEPISSYLNSHTPLSDASPSTSAPYDPLNSLPDATTHLSYNSPQSTEYFQQPSIWNVSPGYTDQNVLQSPSAAVDPRFLTYNPPVTNPDTGSAGSTPPLPPPFDASGLPFAGLDFLHSFAPGGYSGGNDQSMDALWQSVGAGAFNFDPELQFSLDDMSKVEESGS